jgi:hypothetical protein
MRSWPSALAVVALALVMWSGRGAAEELLPPTDAVAGWKRCFWSRPGGARTYTPKTLFEYIDGAADLFLAYGFQGLTAGEYVKEGEQDRRITVDVYDMGAPLHAYGVFASERPEEGAASESGMLGYRTEGLVALWKGSHYVKISVLETEDEVAACALAAETAQRLPGSAELPGEFDRLPAKGRIAGSERYVKKDALGHKALQEVVSAQYKVGAATATVHVCDLATAEAAKQALGKLRGFEAKAGKGLTGAGLLGPEAFAVKDTSYGEMVVAREGRFVIIGTLFLATSTKTARETEQRSKVVALAQETVGSVREAEARIGQARGKEHCSKEGLPGGAGEEQCSDEQAG